MDTEKISLRLNHKNYALWEFQFRVFVKGHGLLGILNGTTQKPLAPAPEQEIARWGQQDARIRSWILGSVDPTIALGLRLHTTAFTMWSHLASTYSSVNPARQFEIECALGRLEQGNKDVTAYFSDAQELWIEQDLLTATLRSKEASAEVLEDRQRSRLCQFLMKLRPEFEAIRSTLLNREDLKFDGVLGHLVREETRLRTQAQLDVRPGEGETVFAAAADHSQSIAAAVQRPQFQRRVPATELECHHCHERGHLQKHCRRKNFCVYCKRNGHIVLDCRSAQRAAARSASAGTSADRSAHAPADRPAYAVQAPLPAPPGPAVDVATVEQVVNSALQRSLPGAISSAFAALQATGKPRPWLLDSGCFNHMTKDAHQLCDKSPVHNMTLRVANGQQLNVHGIGQVHTTKIALPNTLHVPALVPNLVSVGQLTEQGCSVLFEPSGCVIQDLKTGRQIGRGSKQGRVFHLEELSSRSGATPPASIRPVSSPVSRPVSSPSSLVSSVVDSVSRSKTAWELWHARLGHPNSVRLMSMFKQNLLGPNKGGVSSVHKCTSCIDAKLKSISFSPSQTVISEPFHIVHTDLWGPSPTVSRHGFRYFALFVDHATRFTWVYFLRLKSDLLAVASEFLNMVRTQFNRPVKIVRSDPGGEFSSHPLRDLYRSLGTLCQKSCPGVSQQNGLVERKNRHVVELTRALLLDSHVPSIFWPEAVATAVRLINYQITPVLDHRSPFFTLFSKHPDYTRLRVFGCTCFVLTPKKERNKFSSKAARCMFLGYSDVHKGYLCYDPVLSRIRIACTVVFFESLPFHSSSPAASLDFLSPVPTLPSFDEDDGDDDLLPPPPPDDSDLSPSPAASPASSTCSSSASSSSASSGSEPPASPASSISSAAASPQPAPVLRRSLRSTKGHLPARFADYHAYGISAVAVPTRFKQAAGDPNWDNAMKVEMDALHARGTWTMVDRPPPPVPIVGSRWVYNIKVHPDGTIERFKARVVAQGYTQVQGIDYDETFAPVAKMTTVRTLLAVAALRDWPLLQLDVKNAFLHGDLQEVVYMEPPPGYTLGAPGQVCLLHRSLYGLKQAPRAWFDKFQSTILTLGFSQSLNDPSLFTRVTSTGIVALLLYVDDMVVTGDDAAGIQLLKEGLQAAFDLKDLGTLTYFLGLEVTRSPHGILLNQTKYITDLLDDHQFEDCTPVRSPMELNLKLRRDSGAPLVDSSKYRSIVGSLIYLAATRPDISYAVQIVSHFMTAPTVDHLSAVHRILRYLQGTREVGLFFPSQGSLSLQAFSDSDFAGCTDTRRSTTGWCVRFGHSFISWRCKKQDRVAKSSTEAEYRSMSDVASEVVWLTRLLVDLGVRCPPAVDLFVDNTSAIQIALNPVLHDRTKHIELHIHYVRDQVRDGSLRLHYVASEDQIADLLTKALPISRHWYLSGKLMLRDRHQFGGGC
ncbi:unnamed protein product [Linum trigynum]|uniref:Integrase catalytic domain-containing protein n=1 Tax=Linum trigynum TaxID=586398 RepID=A0AAV2G399_9ROSI